MIVSALLMAGNTRNLEISSAVLQIKASIRIYFLGCIMDPLNLLVPPSLVKLEARRGSETLMLCWICGEVLLEQALVAGAGMGELWFELYRELAGGMALETQKERSLTPMNAF